tara:strand:+ start:213 stop:374 length:162 start_codon:yes stop_codon:yes gene_type:complete
MDILKKLIPFGLLLLTIIFIQYIFSQSNNSNLNSQISIDTPVKFPKDIYEKLY